MNPDWWMIKYIYSSLLSSIENEKGETLFFDAPSGNGKTFVINVLFAKSCRKKDIDIALDSSEIAGTLLDGGRTAHSMICLALNISRLVNPVCNTKNSCKPVN